MHCYAAMKQISSTKAVSVHLAGHDQREEGKVHINQLLRQLAASCKADHLMSLNGKLLTPSQ